MEGMGQQAYAGETTHDQFARKENKGFSEKMSETAQSVGQKATEMGHKVSDTLSGLTGHEKSTITPDGGFMPGRNLPEGKDLHAIQGFGALEKRELQESAADKAQNAPQAISGLEQDIQRLGFGDKLQDIGLQQNQNIGLQNTNLGGFMPGRNLPEGQDLHMVAGFGESAKRELLDSAKGHAQNAPGAITGLEQDRGFGFKPELEQKSEGGIINSIKSTAVSAASQASATAGSVKDTVVQAGHTAYDATSNALLIAKDKALEVGAVAKDKALEVGAKAKELMIGASDKGMEAGAIAKDKALEASAVAKDKALEVGAKAKEMVAGATERSSERKGSVPDASQQFPGGANPYDNQLNLDKNLLGKERVYEKGTFEKTYEQGTFIDKNKGFEQNFDQHNLGNKAMFEQDVLLEKPKDDLARNQARGVFE